MFPNPSQQLHRIFIHKLLFKLHEVNISSVLLNIKLWFKYCNSHLPLSMLLGPSSSLLWNRQRILLYGFSSKLPLTVWHVMTMHGAEVMIQGSWISDSCTVKIFFVLSWVFVVWLTYFCIDNATSIAAWEPRCT